MVRELVNEYVLLRNQVSTIYNQIHKLNKEKDALEKRCSALGSELVEEDLPDLKVLISNPYTYTSIELKLRKPIKTLESDLPWTT